MSGSPSDRQRGKAAAERAVTIAYEMKGGLDRGHLVKVCCPKASKAVQISKSKL
jgi:hypothetical protein